MARHRKPKHTHLGPPRLAGNQPSRYRRVPSLLGAIQAGNEYGSIVGCLPPEGTDLTTDLVRAIKEIETLRGRPCLAYVGNVVRRDDGDSGIDASDDLPFAEMVTKVPAAHREVDVLLATRGGSAHQVSRFVNALRARFDRVDFVLPTFCMSAGTLFALSGDRIWMTARACLGPIDPQVPSKDGRYLPAQALLLLVKQLQDQGAEALVKGQPVPWTAVRIIDSIDKKELGDAITASQYSTMMAATFLENHKLAGWTAHLKSGVPVTVDERRNTAQSIAEALANHDRWKNHGHAISRDVLHSEVGLLVDHPDATLEAAILRAWALFHWMFDKLPTLKCMLSADYRYVRNAPTKESAS